MRHMIQGLCAGKFPSDSREVAAARFCLKAGYKVNAWLMPDAFLSGTAPISVFSIPGGECFLL